MNIDRGSRRTMPVLISSGYVRELIFKPFTVDDLGQVFDRIFRAKTNG